MNKEKSMFKQVKDMHMHHAIHEFGGKSIPLTESEYRFRIKLMFKSLLKYCSETFHEDYHSVFKSLENDMNRHLNILPVKDIGVEELEKQFDALIDLTVLTMGTAEWHGFPFERGFDRVMKSNMNKEVGPGKRGSQCDLLKPPEWVPPRLTDLVDK